MVKSSVLPGRRTKQDRKKTSASEALLRVVSDIMIEKQSLDVSFTEISERSGLASALIKYYFGSKQGLLIALAERDAAFAINQLDLLRNKPVSTPEKLRIHIAGIISSLAKAPYINKLVQFLAGNSDREQATQIEETFTRRIIDFHRDLIDQGVREGTMYPIDPMHFFFIIFGMCDHIFTHSYVLRTQPGERTRLAPALLKDYTESVLQVVARGVVREPNAPSEAG